MNGVKSTAPAVSSTAYGFGFMDAKVGRDVRGSAYYVIGSQQWKEYNAGYIDGWEGDPGRVAWLHNVTMVTGFPDLTDADVDRIMGQAPHRDQEGEDEWAKVESIADRMLS